MTFDDGSVASENFFQGETFELTFDTPGTFRIYCSLHGNPGGTGMSTVVTVVERTEENIAEVAEEIAAQPEPVPIPPTPAPVVPPAPIALIEPPAEAADRASVAGILSFRDHVGVSDSVVLSMGGVSPAEEGMELHAWLTSRDGQVLDIGVVEPDVSGKIFYVYRDPTRQNLMASFDGVQISTEAQGANVVTPGKVLYSGRQSPAAYSEIRNIIVSAVDTPDGRGYGIGARLQTEELIRHTSFVQLSFELGNLGDAQRHAEHIINILEGETGEFYGDHDGVHDVQNPGNGFGLIPYIERMAETAANAGNADDATRAIQTHAIHVEIATENALETAKAIREAAFAILDTNSVGDIGDEVKTLQRLGQRLLLGEDEDGNGILALIEGGVFIAYQHAQYMGAIGI
ncbi:MAG: hypothetical protein ACE5JP_15615 [Candidatus Bipolaricaulia bacterium]